MAGRIFSNLRAVCQQAKSTDVVLKRYICTTSSLNEDNRGWLDKLLVGRIEPSKESHSRMLSDKEAVYELQTHDLKPGSHEEYLKNYAQYVEELKDRHPQLDLCGSWSVAVGDQDQCVHLWKYEHGYPAIDDSRPQFAADKALVALEKERNKMLRSRNNQFLLAFSFWPQISARTGGNIYEIRSYFLKPGTMIEWGNNWARAITFRQSHNEAFAGFFSQVGRLYNVHHIWCYGSLQKRKEQREGAWRKPGWDEVVAYTVPLIENYTTKVLYANEFSPTN